MGRVVDKAVYEKYRKEYEARVAKNQAKERTLGKGKTATYEKDDLDESEPDAEENDLESNDSPTDPDADALDDPDDPDADETHAPDPVARRGPGRPKGTGVKAAVASTNGSLGYGIFLKDGVQPVKVEIVGARGEFVRVRRAGTDGNPTKKALTQVRQYEKEAFEELQERYQKIQTALDRQLSAMNKLPAFSAKPIKKRQSRRNADAEAGL